MKKIAERQHVDFDTFHNELVPANQPIVIRSMIEDWPAIGRCARSPTAACDYLAQLDSDSLVDTLAAPPEVQGRFFYNDDFSGVNFERAKVPLHRILAHLISSADDPAAHSIAVQALSIREVLPSFEKENSTSLLNPAIRPTMWINNRGKVAPHFDIDKNLACVIAGRREFTVFPPEQIANLYIGPLLNTPNGVPISLVDIWNPDLEMFPRFADALAVAQVATLEPGDALYIPSLWWHAVQSLESINVLVNYWWGGQSTNGVSPLDSLMHGMLTIAGLDEAQRHAWRDYFEHYVFRTGGNPAAHLPDGIQDIVTSLSPGHTKNVRNILSQRLKWDD